MFTVRHSTTPFAQRLLRHSLPTGFNLRLPPQRGLFSMPPLFHPFLFIRPWRINSGYSPVANRPIGQTPFSNRPLAGCGCAFSLTTNMVNHSTTCFNHPLNCAAMHRRRYLPSLRSLPSRVTACHPVVPTLPLTPPCHLMPSMLPMTTSLNVSDVPTVRNARMFRNWHRCPP